MYASRPYRTALSMPRAVWVASWAATRRSFCSKAGFSFGAAQEHGRADHPAAAAQRRQDGPVAARQRVVQPEQLGQGRLGRRGGPEDGPYAAQHLGERPARADLAQLGRGQVALRPDERQLAEVELAGGPRGPGEVHPRADGAAHVGEVVDRPEPVGPPEP